MKLRLQRNEQGRRELVLRRNEMIERVEPLEGTNISLFNSIIPAWWAENGLVQNAWAPGDAYLADRVWVANRCIQLNAQQIASMPLRFIGPDGAQPAWLTNPDSNWFPNGIGDAVYAMVKNLYGWGFCCLLVTDRYITGYPRYWTVLDSAQVQIRMVDGARAYKYGEADLVADDVVQIDRDPGCGLHGTSALRSYAQQAWGLLAAGNQSMNVNQGGIPQAVIKSAKKITEEQSASLQQKWMQATQTRNGAPPVLGPDIDFQSLSFNPSDLALLETQEFNAAAIASAFGVPAILLNMVLKGGLAYQNPAQLGEQWIWFELQPLSKRIFDALSLRMLPGQQAVTPDVEAMFPPIGPTRTNEPEAAQQVADPGQQPKPLVAVPAAASGGGRP